MRKAERFMSLKNAAELCRFLRLSPTDFNYHLNHPLYYSFKIPKKKGGQRTIQAPNEDLKSIQKKLNYFLQINYLKHVPKAVHGFVLCPKDYQTSRSIISNAQVHVGQNHLLNIDLQDFFPSISAKRVRTVLMSPPFHFNEAVATFISLFGSFEKKLPTGAPSSPVLSNIVCYQMDLELETFCEQHAIRYTRYADDMSFSSHRYFGNMTLVKIRNIIASHDFTVNEKKLRLQSKHRQQVVTGLTVNEKVNVNRRYIKHLRAILHCWKIEGLESAASKHAQHCNEDTYDTRQFTDKIYGKIEFVGQVTKKDSDYVQLFLSFAENFLGKED